MCPLKPAEPELSQPSGMLGTVSTDLAVLSPSWTGAVAPVDRAAAVERLPGFPDQDPYERLALAFLVGYPRHSARAYLSDLKAWGAWCAAAGVHPFDARRHHRIGVEHRRPRRAAAALQYPRPRQRDRIRGTPIPRLVTLPPPRLGTRGNPAWWGLHVSAVGGECGVPQGAEPLDLGASDRSRLATALRWRPRLPRFRSVRT